MGNRANEREEPGHDDRDGAKGEGEGRENGLYEPDITPEPENVAVRRLRVPVLRRDNLVWASRSYVFRWGCNG